MPDLQHESFYDLACQPYILAAARRILAESYRTAAPPEYAQQVQRLVETAFHLLGDTVGDERAFRQAVVELRREVFRKPDADFWFNRVYADYKRHVKPGHRLQRLLPLLRGPRLLDFGSGDGLTSLALQQEGFEPYLTDVLDYRAPEARHLPFQPSADPASTAYPGQVFDNAVLFAVLHHVALDDLLPLLGSLRRSVRRLVIEEDCFGVPPDLAQRPHPACDREQLALFQSLSAPDQRRLLAFIDYFANAITQGLPEMDMPFNFRSVPDWQRLFGEQGFRVEETLLMGFQAGLFNRSCHVWFVLEPVQQLAN
jgi:SAM-dependent methyltransferase